jgi:uncharacterized damage-inducible protein DinB
MVGRRMTDEMSANKGMIAGQIRMAHDGSAWHGPGLSEILTDVDAADAAARPVAGAHTIWELVLHMTAWTREVARRLEGGEPSLPAEGDWPLVGPVSDRSWDTARAALAEAHDALARSVDGFPAARLAAGVGAQRDAPLGTGVSFAEMLHGLAQHDAYHGGQVSLLKKALAGGPRESRP